MNRRSMLTIISAAALAGCGTKVQTDLDLVTAFAVAAGPAIKQASPANAATVDTAVNGIVAVDKALAGVVTPSTPQSTVAQIMAYVQVLAPLAIAALPPGSPYVLAAQAAVALLPVFAAAVGMAGATPVSGMTVAQARVVLRGL